MIINKQLAGLLDSLPKWLQGLCVVCVRNSRGNGRRCLVLAGYVFRRLVALC